MSDTCPACPCKDVCIRLSPTWCEWAAKDPPDPTEIRSICERSRIGHAGYPSAATMAANLAGAVGRVLGAVARGEPVLAPPGVVERRRAICLACEFHDHARGRCTRCGCGGLKLELATEACPLPEPKWPRWEEPTDGDAS